jgi:hypothetical protein
MNYGVFGTPNNIVEAVKIINVLHEALNSRWAINFLLYGSTLRNGVGNDIDICVVHAFRDPAPIIKAVNDWISALGFTNFGMLTDTGALYKRPLDGKEQVLDIWFVYTNAGKELEKIFAEGKFVQR